MEETYTCKSSGSDKTYEVTLHEEWCDFDDEANVPVSILDFESKIE